MPYELVVKSHDHEEPMIVATNEEIDLLLNLFHALSVPLTEPWLEYVHIYEVDGPTRRCERWVDRYGDGWNQDTQTHDEQSAHTGLPDNVLSLLRPISEISDVPDKIFAKLIRPSIRRWQH
jgi:hypothetical protein